MNTEKSLPFWSFIKPCRLWIGFAILIGLYQSPLPAGFRVFVIPPLLLCWILLSLLFVRSLFFANTVDKTFDDEKETRDGWCDIRKSERVKIGLYVTTILALVMAILMHGLLVGGGTFVGAKAAIEQSSPSANEP
ncbi:MAG: hypothetical protein QM680_13605 [Luteolibacter sp.]